MDSDQESSEVCVTKKKKSIDIYLYLFLVSIMFGST
jgi:hypothetical protein